MNVKRKMIALLLTGVMVATSVTGCSGCAEKENEKAEAVETTTDVVRNEEESIVEDNNTGEEIVEENTPENDKTQSVIDYYYCACGKRK